MIASFPLGSFLSEESIAAAETLVPELFECSMIITCFQPGTPVVLQTSTMLVFPFPFFPYFFHSIHFVLRLALCDREA